MGRKPEGSAENLFKNLGKKIDELIEDIKTGADKVRHSERFEELKRNGETLKKEFREFKDSNKDVIDRVDKSFEKAGKEIREAFDRAFKKEGKNKKEA
ncbi:MAG TPA: hypothetical protein PKL31_12180 [Fulvivirga sp.]|nr:hypothetical protein [Fulvivirga sp.]